MISIITAVHNGLAFNKIYLEYLRRYTANPFELIIIDNASSDGTREYFEAQKVCRVIPNDDNYSYPFCQNQGIRAAKGEFLFFLNNDLIVSPQWDERLITALKRHNLDIISGAGIENLGEKEATKAIGRKWKRVKNPLTIFGFGGWNLRLMHRLMYGNWERFCDRRFRRYHYEVVEGIVGNNVMMSRRVASLIDGWDERIQSADFDLFMRAKHRSLEKGDIKPPHIAMGVYIHHYIRLTSKYAVKPRPFADAGQLVKLTEKWTGRQIEELHPDNATLRK